MPHRFFYVYEIKGDINEYFSLSDFYSPIKIDGTEFTLKFKEPKIIESMIQPYYFNNQREIMGNIMFQNRSVPFKVRLKSRLVFVETSFQREKMKILKFFNKFFKSIFQNDVKIDLFTPSNEDEKDFICNTAKYDDFKVFMDDKIVRRCETDEDLCEGLMKDMELIEATLNLKIKNRLITFYYYGNAIQFPHPHDEDIEGVIQTLENTMIVQAK